MQNWEIFQRFFLFLYDTNNNQDFTSLFPKVHQNYNKKKIKGGRGEEEDVQKKIVHQSDK